MLEEETYNSLLEYSRQMLLADNDLESILFFLRQHGCTIVDSIRMVTKLQDIDPGEAKLLVHYSETWSDVRLQNEAVHEALLKEVDNPTQGLAA
jgi:hypothetical protein